MENNYLTQTKVSKSSNNKGKSFTYSTVIPKVIITKFGLDKGTKLYWNIGEDTIIITPELPESKSVEAGQDILTEILFNKNGKYYQPVLDGILNILKNRTDLNKEDKIKELLQSYDLYKTGASPKEYTKGFKTVITYLLDYPLDIPNQYEILQAVYKEITKD